ncbi:hypothetical protein, partial [Klebsiella pneumoniae]|uniref:hypothetical protein n=1 Tax=Klebsiella pneumoniae TaxID=573 RepID=UPI00296ACD1A
PDSFMFPSRVAYRRRGFVETIPYQNKIKTRIKTQKNKKKPIKNGLALFARRGSRRRGSPAWRDYSSPFF